MDEFLRFVTANFSLVIAGIIAWLVIVILASMVYRSINKKGVSPLTGTEFQFSEKGASGWSHKNFLTKLGGARNCLNVELGRAGLWIRPFFPFNLMFLPELYDLEHFIPREKIQGVNPQQRIWGKSVVIDFTSEKGIDKRVELRLRKHDEFLRYFTV
ncbi:hypothetical protein ACFL3A_09325 [Pseudomonadota bacterium]